MFGHPASLRIDMTSFLVKDVGTLSRWYAQEPQAALGIPYVHLQRWSIRDRAAATTPLRIKVLHERFQIQRERPRGWLDVTERAIAALAADGHDLARSEPLIRVTAFDPSTSTLTVQRAEYNDQRRSNLVLDFRVSGLPTLREMLQAEYGPQLPPLSDPRLANTLGIALLVLVSEGTRPLGYCVKRAKKGVAVFQNTWACTASGAAKWPAQADEETFWAHIVRDMLAELEEEVGLTEQDLGFFMPVAFSREMHRGGKPQMFFLASTTLTPAVLKERRRKARRVAAALRQPLEVEADTLLQSAARFVDITGDPVSFLAEDMSHEASATLVEAAAQLDAVRISMGIGSHA